MRQFLDFNLIWEAQSLPPQLIKLLERITRSVYDEVTDPPGGIANITQWCKKEACWERVKELGLNVSVPHTLLVSREQKKYEVKTEKSEKVIESGIQMQAFVVQTPLDTWPKLYDYFLKSGQPVSSMQMDLLKKMSNGTLALPSDKQSKILYDLFHKAKDDGFVILS